MTLEEILDQLGVRAQPTPKPKPAPPAVKRSFGGVWYDDNNIPH
jgi:hypothetical protein